MTKRKVHPSIIEDLENVTDSIVERLISIKDEDFWIEKILDYRKVVGEENPNYSAIGVDGSMMSSEILGGLKLYAISAAAARYEDGEIFADTSVATAFTMYDVKHVSAFASVLMSALEAFLAYSRSKNVDYVFLDGMLRAVYINNLGVIAGLANTLENELIIAFRDTFRNNRMRERVYKKMGIREGDFRDYVITRKTEDMEPGLYRAVQNGLNKAIKEFLKAFDSRSGKVDVKLLNKLIDESVASDRLIDSIVTMVEDMLGIEVYDLELALKDRKPHIDPIINAFAAFGVYLHYIDKLLSNLGNKTIIGVSKRIFRNTIQFEFLKYYNLEMRSAIGRVIMNSPRIESPGYMSLPVSGIYKPPELKLSARFEGIKRVSDALEGKRTAKIKEMLFKAASRSVLRVEIISERDISYDEVASVLASMTYIGRPGSSLSASLHILENAHRYCSLTYDLMTRLSSRIRNRIHEE